MNKDRQMQYYAKIMGALQALFEKDGEFQIPLKELDGDALNDFLHCLATRCPQMVLVKLTGQELDPLEFNSLATRLIFQDAQEK